MEVRCSHAQIQRRRRGDGRAESQEHAQPQIVFDHRRTGGFAADGFPLHRRDAAGSGSCLAAVLAAAGDDVEFFHRRFLCKSSAADAVRHGEQGLLLRLFACAHYLDADEIPAALIHLEAAESLWDQTMFERPDEILADFVFINAFYKRDLNMAQIWWHCLETLPKIDKDADYWRARTALLWLEGQREQAREAWKRGSALAHRLPAAGLYETTRMDFAKLLYQMERPVDTAPPALAATRDSLRALAAACEVSQVRAALDYSG